MIDWSKIDTILLDMDGTLLDLHYDLDFWLQRLPMAYANKHNIPYNQAKDKVRVILEAEIGQLHWYSLDYWQEVFNIDIIAQKHETAHLIQLHKYALDFLTQVKNSHKQVYLVTNAHRKTLKLKMQYQDILPFFDDVISSHDFGYAKENPNFWHHFAQKIKFDKQKTIFFDDSESVLKAAKNYGIQYNIAMSKPSSTQAENTLADFINIKSFNEINAIYNK